MNIKDNYIYYIFVICENDIDNETADVEFNTIQIAELYSSDIAEKCYKMLYENCCNDYKHLKAEYDNVWYRLELVELGYDNDTGEFYDAETTVVHQLEIY